MTNACALTCRFLCLSPPHPSLGKIQRGAHKRGLKPQIFRANRGEILPGKSGLFGANWRHFRADRGLFGADRDQFLCTPQPRGKSRNCPERPFLARLAPFGLSPPLLSPRLDFPDSPSLTPFPFSLIFHRKSTPHHPPEPDPKPLQPRPPVRTRAPSRKLPT